MLNWPTALVICTALIVFAAFGLSLIAVTVSNRQRQQAPERLADPDLGCTCPVKGWDGTHLSGCPVANAEAANRSRNQAGHGYLSRAYQDQDRR